MPLSLAYNIDMDSTGVQKIVQKSVVAAPHTLRNRELRTIKTQDDLQQLQAAVQYM